MVWFVVASVVILLVGMIVIVYDISSSQDN